MTKDSDEFFEKREKGHQEKYKKYTISEFIKELSGIPPDYKVIVVEDMYMPPSPWSDDIWIEVDHAMKVVRLHVEMV